MLIKLTLETYQAQLRGRVLQLQKYAQKQGIELDITSESHGIKLVASSVTSTKRIDMILEGVRCGLNSDLASDFGMDWNDVSVLVNCSEFQSGYQITAHPHVSIKGRINHV